MSERGNEAPIVVGQRELVAAIKWIVLLFRRAMIVAMTEGKND